MPYERSQKIVQLMQESRRDRAWLLEAVQAAIELELATLPPYLCARWSINDLGVALDTLRAIVFDEMAHMGLMCNLLRALGAAPRIVEMAPRYPGPLPGGVRPELTVYLSGLSHQSLSDVMMAIEKPETPLAFEKLAETFTSVGRFYEAIAAALGDLKPPLSATGQLTRPEIGVTVLTTVAEAIVAVDRIREQGEGTGETPFFGGKLAHYYRFGEIECGRKFIEVSPGKFDWLGDPVPFPSVLPMARVPEGGWPNRDPDGAGSLKTVNDLYRGVLEKLESAWNGGGDADLSASVLLMTRMAVPARKVMRVSLGDGLGNYGPDFLI